MKPRRRAWPERRASAWVAIRRTLDLGYPPAIGTALNLRALIVVLAALPGGCALLGTPQSPPSTAESSALDPAAAHDAAVSALTDWRLNGRIAVQRDDQGFSAGIVWRQRGDAYDLRISAPLNGGTFAVRGDEHLVTLLTPQGDTYTASDAESLLAQHLGWTLPVGGARYWVRGLVEPGAAVSGPRRDPQGRWTDFAQAGWRVSILAYGEDQSPALPRKLFLSRDTLKVRMAIKQWEQF